MYNTKFLSQFVLCIYYIAVVSTTARSIGYILVRLEVENIIE